MIKHEVMHHDCNADIITSYDVLRYLEPFIKKLKKNSKNKEEFKKALDREFLWRYWSKAECELIISIDENNRVWLSPWCGSRKGDEISIDVTDKPGFDWKGFAKEHCNAWGVKSSSAKIDIYDQINYGDTFDNLVDDLWYTRLKYERYNPKFDKELKLDEI